MFYGFGCFPVFSVFCSFYLFSGVYCANGGWPFNSFFRVFTQFVPVYGFLPIFAVLPIFLVVSASFGFIRRLVLLCFFTICRGLVFYRFFCCFNLFRGFLGSFFGFGRFTVYIRDLTRF